MTEQTTLPAHVDVLIVGAGLSGIGAARRLQRHHPELTYLIVEARSRIGGTWDLFRYPGVRSDSDMSTLGYRFRPWRGERAFASGPEIRSYIEQTASVIGADRRIRFSHRVTGADFDSAASRWTVTLNDGSATPRTITCGFLYSCTGYYDYENPHRPHFEGEEDFTGQIIHPQHWPQGQVHAGRRVAVIGSGATAVTLVPALLEGPDAASQVTMIQRSPTWIGAVPGVDPVAQRIRKFLPDALAQRVVRTRSILTHVGLYQACQRLPKAAGRYLNRPAERLLGPEQVAEHFHPDHRPWDQRLCASPDADIFRAIRSGGAQVRTCGIARFVPDGVELTTGEVIPADIIVTATGLRLQPFGGLTFTVDGRPVNLAEQYVWKGTMVTGMPNFGFAIGYVNASWTLRSDLCHRVMCDVLTWMRRGGHRGVVPQAEQDMEARPILDLNAGYIRRSIADFPRQGDRHPWLIPQNYPADRIATLSTHRTDGLVPLA